MKTENCISRKEYILLLTFTLAGFLFFASVYANMIIRDFNYDAYEKQNSLRYAANGKIGPNFSACDYGYKPFLYSVYPYHILNLLIFAVLLKTKRFIIPFLLTILYGFLFIYSFYNWQESEIGKTNYLLYEIAKDLERIYELLFYDFVLYFFIILFWQISILLRRLFRNSQIKNSLP